MSQPAREYLFFLEQFGIKLGLEQIHGLLTALDRPERTYPAIVVAGTNGKGSVTAMIERGLRAAGLRTGRYTSPHLEHIEERVAIDGEPVTAADFDRAAERVQHAAESLPAPPTFFEATTALALDVFREARVDVAVLEVGLGGRLDATNAVTPVAAVITAVDFDHEEHLGGTLDAIAREKAGIIKTGALVILGANPTVVRQVVSGVCDEKGATLVYAPDEVATGVMVHDGRSTVRIRTPHRLYDDATLSLRGRHQVDNAILAVRVLEEAAARGLFEIPPEAIHTALTDVTWPARLELLPFRGGTVLIDGAHNPAGAAALASYLDENYGRRVPIVFGVMKDKRAGAMIAALVPAASHLIVTAAASDRAMAIEELGSIATDVAPVLPVHRAATPAEALAAARALGDPVVVAGSLYLAGEVRAHLLA